jgi:hypothetical protein
LSALHAVVIGWAGATERQLRGVVRWYGARGASAFSARPRIFHAMAFPNGWRREGEALAGQLTERAPEGAIAVHAFSNAGFWTYAAMLRALDAGVRDRIALAVIDSAPGFPERLDPRFTVRHSTMAMMPLLLRALGRPPALSHPVLDAPLRAFMRLWYAVSPTQIRQAEESLAIVRETGAWPLLFLYSNADSLVPAEHVGAFVASVRGREVHELRWDDSENVRHMLVHRGEYFDAIAARLAAVLQRP